MRDRNMSFTMPDDLSAQLCAQLPKPLLNHIDQMARVCIYLTEKSTPSSQPNPANSTRRVSSKTPTQKRASQPSTPRFIIDLTKDDEQQVEDMLELPSVEQYCLGLLERTASQTSNTTTQTPSSHPFTPRSGPTSTETSPSNTSPENMASPLPQQYQSQNSNIVKSQTPQYHGRQGVPQPHVHPQHSHSADVRHVRPQSRASAANGDYRPNPLATPHSNSLGMPQPPVRQLSPQEQQMLYHNHQRMIAYQATLAQHMQNQNVRAATMIPGGQLPMVALNHAAQPSIHQQSQILTNTPAYNSNAPNAAPVVPAQGNVSTQQGGPNNAGRAQSEAQVKPKQFMKDVCDAIQQRRAQFYAKQGVPNATPLSNSAIQASSPQYVNEVHQTVPNGIRQAPQSTTLFQPPHKTTNPVATNTTISRKRSVSAVDAPESTPVPAKAVKIAPTMYSQRQPIVTVDLTQTAPTPPPLQPPPARPAQPAQFLQIPRISPYKHTNNAAMHRIEKTCLKSRVNGLRRGEEWAYTMGNSKAEKPHYHFGEDVTACSGCKQLGLGNIRVLQRIHDRFQGNGGL